MLIFVNCGEQCCVQMVCMVEPSIARLEPSIRQYLLLAKGASIEILNKDNNTPLHLAVLNGHTGKVQLLKNRAAEHANRHRTRYELLAVYPRWRGGDEGRYLNLMKLDEV